ncbi:MAG: hypothetical protein IT196_16370 [Acidimicrobiales bacterium]|nr:hypothetical protein [Acidimicrobiales bacterium]
MRLRRGVLAVGVFALLLGVLSGRAIGLRTERLVASVATCEPTNQRLDVVVATFASHEPATAVTPPRGPVAPHRSDPGPWWSLSAHAGPACVASLLQWGRTPPWERARPTPTWRGGAVSPRAPPPLPAG